jgi:hypothetical protein
MTLVEVICRTLLPQKMFTVRDIDICRYHRIYISFDMSVSEAVIGSCFPMLENKLGKKNWLSGKKHIDLWWLLDYLIISLTTIRSPPDSSHMKSEDYNLHFFLS